MLYSYPVEATDDNWLHEALCAMLQDIHHRVDSRAAIGNWTDLIPTAYRDRLCRRTGLRDRLVKYEKAIKRLTRAQRAQVLQTLDDQNKIAELVSCQANCDAINDVPGRVHAAVENLFEYAYETLFMELGVRDQQYQVIYEKRGDKLCPFCGCEFFDAPDQPKEDTDHYLAKSIYPFAAVNLCNLAPMGQKCNEKYKLAKDILYDKHRVRRRSFYPYANIRTNICLDASQPCPGTNDRLPKWQIDFDPMCSECDTWDDVFRIRERYESSILNPFFFSWLGCFADWFKGEYSEPTPPDSLVADALNRYVLSLQTMRLSGRDFLRVPVFRMLHKHYVDGNQELRALINDTIHKVVTETPQNQSTSGI